MYFNRNLAYMIIYEKEIIMVLHKQEQSTSRKISGRTHQHHPNKKKLEKETEKNFSS